MARLTKEQNEKYFKYILGCIDNQDYCSACEEPEPKEELKTDKEKLGFLLNQFKAEKGHEIERVGFYKAFEEWIRGLPSCFNIEFMNYKILELAKRLGTLNKNATESEEDKIINNYWNFITLKTFRLMKINKIEVL